VSLLQPNTIVGITASSGSERAHSSSASAPRTWACVATLLLADLAALLLSAAASIITWRHLNAALNPEFYLKLWPVLFLFPVAYAASGLYPGFGRSPVDELRRLCAATSLVYPALAVTIFLLKDAATYSRPVFLMAWAQSLVAVPLIRALIRGFFAREPWWGDSVVVVGVGESAAEVAASLAGHAELGLKPALILSEPRRASELKADSGISHAILVASPRMDLAKTYGELSQRFPRVTVVPDLTGLSSLWVEARDLGGIIGLEIRQQLIVPGAQFIKRAIDLCLILAVAVVALPLVMLIAGAIKLNSRGPVFYGHVRYGRGGKPFVAWKFRSMVVNAGAALERCLESNPALRGEWKQDHKLKRDPRVTAVGRFLRKTSLDELPQIWNVLLGQMSVVGPRPIVADEIPLYGSVFDLYKQVTPGITGLWQVSGRNRLTYEQRVRCDLYYIRNWSPWLDLYILARTVAAVLLMRGAY
jgi:Undecaprenyl-phosphate galactose phosphotransferase WbaP